MFFCQKSFFRFKLNPQFPGNHIERINILADQLTGLIILCRNPSLNKDLCVHFHKTDILFIVSWEHNDLHSSHQIFQGKESHDLVRLGIFNSFSGDHTADHSPGAISYFWHAGLFIRLEIGSHSGDIFFPSLCIFFQRMTAYIHAQDFFFKSQLGLFWIFLHVRHTDLEGFLLFIRDQIKQTHLPCHDILFLLIYGVQYLGIDHHFLPSVTGKTVKSSGFDKVFNSLFIYVFSRHTFNKILEIFKFSSFLTFFYNGFYHRSSDTFNSGQPIADSPVIHRKLTLSFVDIRRKNGNPHLPAGKDIFRHLRRVIDDRSHKSSHKLYREIILQIGCLIRDHRISRRMGFIKGILCKIDHLIIDLICHLF